MEEEVIIILTPGKKGGRSAEGSGYMLHTVGGELTDKQKREILRTLLKDLRED